MTGNIAKGRTIPAGVLLLDLVALAALIVLVSGGWNPLHSLDLTVTNSLNHYIRSRPGQIQAWKIVSVVGGPTVLRIVAVGVAVLLWWRGRRRVAALVVVAMATAAVVSELLKVLVHRPRPMLTTPVDFASGGSFPSGHALTSFVAAGLLLFLLAPTLSRRWRVPVSAAAIVLAVAVAFSRLALGVHYLSDVLGSWLIGAALLLLAIRWLNRRPAGEVKKGDRFGRAENGRTALT